LLFTFATTGMPWYASRAHAARPQPPATMLPLEITEVILEDGQLVALGTLGSNTFRAPITVTPQANPANPACPILNLELGPIHLDLLGLVVDTSAICVRITAEPGEGALLGNLLCTIAGLLDNGLNLGDILAGLNPEQLLTFATFLEGLADLLNDILGQATAPTSVVGVSSSEVALANHAPGHNGGGAVACDVLNLAVGPLDLNLLGLDVEADDCEGRPITVDITAEPGAGRLLGNLLCGLAGLLDGPADAAALARALNRIADAILNLIG
jgi:hypothetical protein